MQNWERGEHTDFTFLQMERKNIHTTTLNSHTMVDPKTHTHTYKNSHHFFAGKPPVLVAICAFPVNTTRFTSSLSDSGLHSCCDVSFPCCSIRLFATSGGSEKCRTSFLPTSSSSSSPSLESSLLHCSTEENTMDPRG